MRDESESVVRMIIPKEIYPKRMMRVNFERSSNATLIEIRPTHTPKNNLKSSSLTYLVAKAPICAPTEDPISM